MLSISIINKWRFSVVTHLLPGNKYYLVASSLFSEYSDIDFKWNYTLCEFVFLGS